MPWFAVLVVAAVLFVGCAERVPRQLKVLVLYGPGGKGDLGWNDTAYLGVLRGAEAVGADVVEQAPRDKDHAAAIFHGWLGNPLGSANELIISLSHTYTATIIEQGCLTGRRHLLHFDAELPPCDTFTTVHYEVFAPAFVAGAASMSMSEVQAGAALGGLRIPPVQEFVDGFTAGVESVGATAEVDYLRPSDNGFANRLLGQSKAEEFYASADVVFPVAGGTGLGVIEAAKAEEGRYVIGVDTDQSHLGRSVVLGSVIKRVDLTIEQAIIDVQSERLEPGHRSVGLDEGETSFLLNPNFEERLADVSAAAQAQAIEAAKGYIIPE